jgi:hypothetical protein
MPPRKPVETTHPGRRLNCTLKPSRNANHP